MKAKIIAALRKSKLGNYLYHKQMDLRGALPKADMHFPNLICIELASICNLSCVHCPSHNPKYKEQWRKYGIMDIALFEKAMDEIDAYGSRNIALHKDGEPLLHPHIAQILSRVKAKVNHHVYLTTNGHYLTAEIAQHILDSGINILNISLGAIHQEVYSKIRGGDIQKVLSNVEYLLKLKAEQNSPLRVNVQIINLEEENLTNEIDAFKKYWANKDVKINVWDELTWGIKELKSKPAYRYPCFSLWDSFNINSDGKVSACCIDWNQQLVMGDFSSDSIATIWQSPSFQQIRNKHIAGKEHELPLCDKCNYWFWQPMLMKY